jgi:hypothetical protein
MATDLYRDKLYNDGEGLTHGELNDTRAWMLARMADQLLEHQAGILGSVNDPSMWGQNGADTDLQSLIYTLTGGEAVIKQGTTATRVSTIGGTIFQKVASAAGTAPTFLPYTFAPDEFDLVIGAGDATNPRIDIVQVRLQLVDGGSESRDFKDAITGALTSTATNKTRRVDATVSIKAGTPAATPTYPAPDAGYAVLGAIRVPATWTTGTTADGTGSASAGLRQCSVPLRIEPHTMSMGADVLYNSATTWELISAGVAQATGGAGNDLVVWCPGGHTKRIVGVSITARWITSGVVHMRRIPWTAGGYSLAGAPVIDLSSVLVNADSTLRTYFAHLGNIADASEDSNPSAANGPIGDAFWAAGGKGGPTHRPVQLGGAASTTQLGHRTALVIDGGTNTIICEVTWYLAG